MITRQDPAGGRLLKKKMHAVKSMERRFAREDEKMTEMPEQESAIFFKLGGDSSKIPAGKTTLIRKLASELLERSDIHAEYMPQNYEEILDMDITPVEFLDTTGDKAEQSRIRTYLGSLKYTPEEMNHAIAKLSGGQKAKVLLLKLSLSGANVLILDEPTRNFSPLSAPVIRKMLRNFPGAVISVSHDRKYIEEVCDTVYKLTEDGLQRVFM